MDVTFGGGGHSKAILEQLSEHGKLFVFDQDQIERNSIEDSRFYIDKANFLFFLKIVFENVSGCTVDGILAVWVFLFINLM